MTWKGLTQRAQKVISFRAQEEAKRCHAENLMPEHIILALLKDGEGVAVKALQRVKVNIDEMRRDIERSLTQGKGGLILGDIEVSERAQAVLKGATREAKNMGHVYVGTEHLLLAAARDEAGATFRYLAQRNVSPEQLREAIIRINGLGEARQSSSAPKRRTQTATRKPTPTLDEFSRDLTTLAREGKLDPVVGRTREIQRVIQILARRTKNNPVLIGEPGVGKTAIVEGLAQKVVNGTAPDVLHGRRVLTLDLASLVAGTKYRGEFEERLKRVMKEIVTAGNIVMFIDELHTIIGAGGAEGAIDASNMLKPALSRGELQCIGATTLAEHRKYIERDAALERRFQSVFVDEPSVEETVEILKGIKDRYAQFHGVVYTYEALEAAASLSARYISDRHLPDKAIDLLDESGSRSRIDNSARPKDLVKLDQEIERLMIEKTNLVNSQNYEKAAAVRDKVGLLRQQLDRQEREWASNTQGEQRLVEPEDIQTVISEITGVPLARIVQSESRRLLEIENELHERMAGQDAAISVVAAAIRRSRTGLSSPKRPMGSFVFLGGSGVGKTELAKTLAEFMFGDEESLIHGRHVGLHGEAQRLAAGGRAAGLRGLRRRRHAHREGAAPALQRHPPGRDREGAPRRVQHPPAGAGGGAAPGPPGTHGFVPQHHPDHDLERGRPRDHPGRVAGLPHGATGDALCRHQVLGAGRDEAAVPPRVPEPDRRGGGLPRPGARAPGEDSEPAAR